MKSRALALRASALILVLALCVTEGYAREHGKPRAAVAITAIIVHTVGGPACQDAAGVRFAPIARRADDATVWRRALRLSPATDAHFVIGRDGNVADVMPVTEVAHHTVGANDVSIGIELVHRGDGREPFEPHQIAALVRLIKTLRRTYPGIALADVVGHDAIDRRTCRCGAQTFRRRQDPGANFPWKQVLMAARLSTDPPRGRTSLTPLEGAAPPEACPAR